ncbi:response regulator transcription factor [Actinoplanes sp. Pm04-4]|uniref:Response regulator transcription factor n=1 Tax=Paractinoplanes pyxinae TaxID=2997416 RepID=A0ABT4B0H0_9ACTN|nr:response regulator transcription factor [Actinoplanes pyxinae]MCY1139989.1 response regulator transcription factor [Actinoplanes pyxinae]
MSDRARRALLVGAVLTGCFTWAMVVVGWSFAMAEGGDPHWWVMPIFGTLVLLIAVLAVRSLPSRAAVASPPAAGVASPGVPAAAIEPLSAREMEVLRHLAAGRSNREIAGALFVAPGTVKAHLSHIFRKLDATSRLQAVAHAREAGLLDL